MKNISESRKHLELGCHLYEEQKLDEALQEFQYAAKLGNVEAQVNLANMFDAGEGGPQNHEIASYWYKQAINQGSPEAAYNLAISYKQQGKNRWFKFWLSRASYMGDDDATDELQKLAKD